jgi:anti-anti-sigma factor
LRRPPQPLRRHASRSRIHRWNCIAPWTPPFSSGRDDAPFGSDRREWLAAQAGLTKKAPNCVFPMAMTSNNPSPAEVVTNFEGSEAILRLRGRVERVDAIALDKAFDAAIDRQPTSMVLDLSELEFMGATAMVAVANAEMRLSEIGAKMTIRSPSELVNRLFEMMASAQMGRPLNGSPHEGHLWAGEVDDRPRWLVASKPEGPTAEFRRMTALPSDSSVVDGALRLVVELARALVGGADGVSVSLQRHGRLSTVAASDQTIMEMDADQYSTGEGPCVDASLLGQWFHAESLDTETRWPAFTPRARGLGINAILSSPLKAFQEPVGALNIYSRTAGAFDGKSQAAAAVFATKASVILSDAGAGMRDTQTAFRYQEALRSRKDITLATGVLMEREDLDEDEAFADLLRLSLHHGVPLRTQAEVIVRSNRQLPFDSEAVSDE